MNKIDNCDWCNLSEEDKQFQVYESKSWSVFLSDEQDYIGRCILVLKRHCNSLSELTGGEWDELRNLICKVEACLKAVLGATLCNWSCLMNNFYKESAPNPHLHIHVRPRYDKPVMLNGNIYSDIIHILKNSHQHIHLKEKHSDSMLYHCIVQLPQLELILKPLLTKH